MRPTSDWPPGSWGWLQLFLAAAFVFAGLGGGDRGVGAEGDAGELADHAGGQLDREVGDLLFGVLAGQVDVEGGVGAGGVVDRAGFEAGVEGRRPPEGQGRPSGPWVIWKELVRGDRGTVGLD